MAKRDYYEILGVPRNADEEDLKKAFRKQAMKHHPDRNPGDKAAEAAFKECNEAYDVLKDGEKRAAYDRYGHAAFESGGNGGGGGFSGGFEDIFEQMFGANFCPGTQFRRCCWAWFRSPHRCRNRTRGGLHRHQEVYSCA